MYEFIVNSVRNKANNQINNYTLFCRLLYNVFYHFIDSKLLEFLLNLGAGHGVIPK